MGKKAGMTVMAGLFAAALFLGGCGQSETSGKKAAATGTAVAAYQMEDQKEKEFWSRVEQELSHPYTSIEGPKGQEYEVKGSTDLWTYYIKETEDQEEEQLCRIPATGGKHLPFDEEEVLSQKSMFFDLYATDAYVIFTAGEGSGDSQCYKLDLFSMKRTTLGGSREFSDAELAVSDNGTPVLFHDRLFVVTDRDVYELDPETGQMQKIYDRTDKDLTIRLRVCQESLYLTSDRQSIYRYDGNGQRAACVLDQDTIRERLDGLKLWKEDAACTSYLVDDIFSHEDRLYLTVTANWERQGRRGKKEECTTEGILLSACVSDIKNIKHENILFDCLTVREEGNELSGEAVDTDIDVNDVSVEDIVRKVYRPSRISGIVDGKVVLDGVEVRPPYVSSILYSVCRAFDPVTGRVTDNPAIEIVASGSQTGYKK